MDTQATRTIAMCMELVGPRQRDPPGRARRHRDRDRAEPPRTRRAAHQPAPSRNATGAASQRERELAEGHAAVRYAAYVTVSAPRDGPGRASRSSSRTSRGSSSRPSAPRLRLERMWGQQAEAFTYTLPLCRGLR